jgi:hypothetical protein
MTTSKRRDHKANLKKAGRDGNTNLDLIQFIRRIRMHGAALTIRITVNFNCLTKELAIKQFFIFSLEETLGSLA